MPEPSGLDGFFVAIVEHGVYNWAGKVGRRADGDGEALEGKPFVQKKDGLVLLLLLGLSLAAWGIYRFAAGGGAAQVAQVIVAGETVLEVPLSQDTSFAVPGRSGVLLEVRDGRCGFVGSDCPDQVCVHSGFLGTTGQYAVCLPNQVAVKIAGGDAEDGVDTMAY